MKILLTGVTGYIGKRLLPVLLQDGHEVVCAVRDRHRFDSEEFKTAQLSVVDVNFLDESTLHNIPNDIDAAYYLIHSMSATTDNFSDLEEKCAINFVHRINQTQAQQVIYLGGITNADQLSKHLASRKKVEDILSNGNYHFTALRAGIIVGSGSASFEIIRDLVEKLPVMVAPKWVSTKSQPIAVADVIQFLRRVLLFPDSFDKSFDIGGPEVLSYRDMLLKMAKVRGLKRSIIPVPVMSPKLSSYWLYFVTSTSYKLAVNLVNSMKVEVVGKPNSLHQKLDIQRTTYEQAVSRAFDKIAQQEVISSWTDAMDNQDLQNGLNKFMKVPVHGCLVDQRCIVIQNETRVLNNIWSIGGERGWYFGNWLWKIRGFIDKTIGGVGLRRGRKNQDHISAGESLDFWRVLLASREDKRLLLYAEMKLPGEAWLEFSIKHKMLFQTATFRPKGILGRLYWYILYPIHMIMFNEMIKRIAQTEPSESVSVPV